MSPRLELVRDQREQEGGLKETTLAGAVIVLAKHYVVLVRPKDPTKKEWLLPKGHQEVGEELSVTATREALEETGASCSIGIPEPIMVTHRTTPTEAQTVNWFILHAAALKTESAEDIIEAGATRRHIGIFPTLVALSRLTYEDQRDVLVTALSPIRAIPEDI